MLELTKKIIHDNPVIVNRNIKLHNITNKCTIKLEDLNIHILDNIVYLYYRCFYDFNDITDIFIENINEFEKNIDLLISNKHNKTYIFENVEWAYEKEGTLFIIDDCFFSLFKNKTMPHIDFEACISIRFYKMYNEEIITIILF